MTDQTLYELRIRSLEYNTISRVSPISICECRRYYPPQWFAQFKALREGFARTLPARRYPSWGILNAKKEPGFRALFASRNIIMQTQTIQHRHFFCDESRITIMKRPSYKSKASSICSNSGRVIKCYCFCNSKNRVTASLVEIFFLYGFHFSLVAFAPPHSSGTDSLYPNSLRIYSMRRAASPRLKAIFFSRLCARYDGTRMSTKRYPQKSTG